MFFLLVADLEMQKKILMWFTFIYGIHFFLFRNLLFRIEKTSIFPVFVCSKLLRPKGMRSNMHSSQSSTCPVMQHAAHVLGENLLLVLKKIRTETKYFCEGTCFVLLHSTCRMWKEKVSDFARQNKPTL